MRDPKQVRRLSKGGKHNGELLAPRRQLIDFGISSHCVGAALIEAVTLGLVDCIRGKGRRPNRFAITWLPTVGAIEPSNRWQHTASNGRTMGAEVHSNGPL